jgi:hypothetical protein
VLLTVHTMAYPSPKVFLRSIGKWGGSFAEGLFYQMSASYLDPGAKTALTDKARSRKKEVLEIWIVKYFTLLVKYFTLKNKRLL